VVRRIRRWLEQWLATPHRDQPLVEPLGRRLLDTAPGQADSTLVHGDYRLGNMLIDVTEPVHINAILDWEMSTLGDPLTDLAHLLVYWDRTRGRLTHESQTIAEQPGFMTAGELAERYSRSSGRDVKDLDFYLAFEHWRAAIIKEGIYSRHIGGQATTDGGDEIGATVSLHLEEAKEILGPEH
jgi:aminoglycoside phosphotransferase (APT) family kinase protein